MSKKKTAKATGQSKPTKHTTRKKAQPPAPPPETAPVAVPPEPAQVGISQAKGRPMLTWVGKRPLSHVTAFPAQLVERHDALRIVGIDPETIETHADKKRLFDDLRSQCNEQCWRDAPFINGIWKPEIGGILLHGDNKDVLAYLLANGYRGKVNLVYIDPPFDSGADYIRKVTLRGPTAPSKLDGEQYSLGEQVQYSDIWANDNYLQWMFERLQLLREVLSHDGSIFLHCDNRRVHHLRCLLDEVFGPDNFVNEIVWTHQIMGGSHDKRFPKAHETLLWYAKADGYRLRSEDPNVRVPFSDYVLNSMQKDAEGRWYYERRRMSRKATAEEAATKAHTRTFVDNPDAGTVATDVWDDMLSYQEPPNERNGAELYPTQKTTKLLTRVVAAGSDRGGLVLDCFAGSGVVMKVAQQLGRRWIGCDINKGAIQTTVKRLRGVIAGQIHDARQAAADARQGRLIDTAEEGEAPPKPCAFGFSVWRVNDYDLQIQHNEAVNLACEHVGIERMRSDSFFDGTLGKRLVKIIPFGHPLTPLDLEEIRRELDARPDEDRGIVVVCLGMELAAKAWMDDWNQLRKGSAAVNKIEAIELRTDPKYGRFIRHEPAAARVEVSRAERGEESRIVVDIQDFISPTIVERLREQAGLLSPKIDDWRAMVDCVYIDADYNGSVFNVVLADVPERKTDFVDGRYELPAPAHETTVAVKIVDMLGEEVLVTATV